MTKAHELPDEVMTQTIQANIPRQKKGAESDTTHAERLANAEDARSFFLYVKQRLLDVNNWDKLCSGVTAKFSLTDSLGNEAGRPANEGDHFKIAIPGPGLKTGDGYDWVKIKTIREDKKAGRDFEQLSMTVQPASNPKNSDPAAAHFFKEGASSTFIVIRDGNLVRAEVHGRNELPNLRPRHIIDRIRNAIIAFGAMLGLSSTQWKKLVKGLVERNHEIK